MTDGKPKLIIGPAVLYAAPPRNLAWLPGWVWRAAIRWQIRHWDVVTGGRR